MNRVLEVSEEAAYALVEPGVEFFGLYEELRSRGSRLWMSVPDLGWGSIVGNTCEHGVGYGVYGDHAAAVCGLEVVLASGEVVRTGLGAAPASTMWQRHKRGFGPSLDSLFLQSNFGIVTKMGIWLLPQPETFAAGSITCQDEDDIPATMDVIRNLLLEGTIQGVPLITTAEPPAGATSSNWAALAKVHPPGRLHTRVQFYGPEALVRAREQIVRNAFAPLTNVTVELRTYPGSTPAHEFHPFDLVPAGVPNMFLLDALKAALGEGVGHIDFSPVIPFDGAALLQLQAMVGEELNRAGLAASIGWGAYGRNLTTFTMIYFDPADAAQYEAAHNALRRLIARARERGWTEYRAHPAHMDSVARAFDFNDSALPRLYSTIKNAVDPKGTLSPGKHGIWPSSR